MPDPQYSRITRLRDGRYTARSIRTEHVDDEQWDNDIEHGIVVLHALQEDGRHLIIFHPPKGA